MAKSCCFIMITLNTEEMLIEVPWSLFRVPLILRIRKSLEKIGDLMLQPPVNGVSHLHLNITDANHKETFQQEILIGLAQYIFATQGVNELRLHGFESQSKGVITLSDIDRLGSEKPTIFSAIVVLLSRHKQVLLGKRPEGKFMPGVWEFPGGKIEKNEGIMAAASRELQEELGIQIHSPQIFTTREFQLKASRLKANFCVASDWLGPPMALTHSEIRWVSLDELPTYPMPIINLICIHDILTLIKK